MINIIEHDQIRNGRIVLRERRCRYRAGPTPTAIYRTITCKRPSRR
ncbi:hypothetical protein [Acidiphilium cryptum]|nr:hypothetical protein [Acidiphilium cryptum]